MGRRTERLMAHQRSMARESMLHSLLGTLLSQGIGIAAKFGGQSADQNFAAEQNQAARELEGYKTEMAQQGQTDRLGISEGQQTARKFKDVAGQLARSQADRESREGLAEQRDWGGYLGDVQKSAEEAGQPGEGALMAGAGREMKYFSPGSVQRNPEFQTEGSATPEVESFQRRVQERSGLPLKLPGKTEQAAEINRAFEGFPKQKKMSPEELAELRQKHRLDYLKEQAKTRRLTAKENAELYGAKYKYKTEADVSKRAATLNLEGDAKPLDLMQPVEDPGYKAPEPPPELGGGRGAPPARAGKFSGKVKSTEQLAMDFKALHNREPDPNEPAFRKLIQRFIDGGGKVSD